MNSGGPAGCGCALLFSVGKEDSLQEEVRGPRRMGGGAGGDGTGGAPWSPVAAGLPWGPPQALAKRRP